MTSTVHTRAPYNGGTVRERASFFLFKSARLFLYSTVLYFFPDRVARIIISGARRERIAKTMRGYRLAPNNRKTNFRRPIVCAPAISSCVRASVCVRVNTHTHTRIPVHGNIIYILL